VRVINLSIGDQHRPFLREMSPLARLIDWLAWKHHLLFIVSAGNHGGLLVEDGGETIEVRTLRALQSAHRHRRLLCPAESINALTVGALHVDDGGAWQPRNAGEVQLVTSDGMPSPVSALGRGHRRSVKPEILAPGGRVVFVRSVDDVTKHNPSLDRSRMLPGQKAATPGPRGALDAEDFSFGTSNAAALTTRAAMQILDAVETMRASPAGATLSAVPDALIAKCLLVHTSTWNRTSFDVLEATLKNEHNAQKFRDHVTGFIGFGSLRTDRALACEMTRATLIGGGAITLESAVQHRVPLPAGLNAYTGVRWVVVTLAWFSPVKPSERNYRVAALDAIVTDGKKFLAIKDGKDVDGIAAKRGTVQHIVFQKDRSAVSVGPDDELVVTVSASPDAEPGGPVSIPYALAVTVEVDAAARVQVYDEVAAKIRTRLRVGVR
jgi:hypothetical protein